MPLMSSLVSDMVEERISELRTSAKSFQMKKNGRVSNTPELLANYKGCMYNSNT